MSLSEVGLAKVCRAEVRPDEFRVAEIGPDEFGAAQAGFDEVRDDLWIRLPPFMPRFDTLPQNLQLLGVCHTLVCYQQPAPDSIQKSSAYSQKVSSVAFTKP